MNSAPWARLPLCTRRAQSGNAAHPRLVRGRAGEPLRRRAPRREPARAPLGEEELPGRLAGQGAAMHRPHHARRRRHAGPRPPPLRQGEAPAAGRHRHGAGPCRDAHRRRCLRLSRHGAARREGAGRLRHSRRLRRHRLPGGPHAAAAAPRRNPLCGGSGCAGDRHRHPPRAGAAAGLGGALRRGRRHARGLRRRRT